MLERLLICLALVLLPGAGPASDDPDPGPVLRCAFRKPEDSFASRQGPAGLVLTITSKTGIGNAQLTVPKGELPRTFVLQFANIDRLESFTFTDGPITASGEYRDIKAAFHFDRAGKAVADRKDAALSLVLDAKKDPRRVEISVEYAASVRPGKDIRLAWINAYRR
jgi:hypothetical protein